MCMISISSALPAHVFLVVLFDWELVQLVLLVASEI